MAIQRKNVKMVDLSDPSGEEEVQTFTPPNFTVKDLLGAIPAHCYERSALKSFGYLFRDFAMIAAFGFAASQISTFFGVDGSILDGTAGKLASYAAWATYWWFQGLVMTGIWVVAHECGHQAFSSSKTLNNAVGLVLHSALLIPYHSWRISHARHHAATGHMDRDEVFVPRTESELKNGVGIMAKLDHLFEDSPLWNFAMIMIYQLFGFPLYLATNIGGQRNYPAGTNHFDPKSVIFDKRHFGQIVASDVGLALIVAALVVASKATSVSTVLAYYGIPYLFVNHWLVLITYLQHTDPNLPHYRANEWNFQRGAICTQDRNVYNFFTHSLANTHVAHHLKSSIPHYHADDATAALKAVLGEHYKFSNEHWLVSLWNVHKQCKYVDDEGDVVFHKNTQGKAQQKVVYESTDSGIEMQD